MTTFEQKEMMREIRLKLKDKADSGLIIPEIVEETLKEVEDLYENNLNQG